jgi:hypothetical protein
MQRHRYQLPSDRARQFATVTGPWEDSGVMAATVSTLEPPTIEAIDSTSTGAMMEFLGGEVGQHLPFSADLNTSRIPLPDFDWTLPTTTLAEDIALDAEIDRFVAETTTSQMMQPVAADAFQEALPTMNDVTMNDFEFDLDVDFDGVFEMPLDETFGQQLEK